MPDTQKAIMELNGDLAPYRVYQRNSQDKANIPFSGTLSEPVDGPVEARILSGSKPLPGLDWHEAGRAEGTTFSGEVFGVPVGGNYTLMLRIRGKDGAGGAGSAGRIVSGPIKVPRLMVGDLWVMAGQSNMDGYGKLTNIQPPSQYVRCFYYDDRWGIAQDPLCWYNEAVDPVHWSIPRPEDREKAIKHDRDFRSTGAGPGVRFGKEINAAVGVPVGLIICSHGGTSMEQWSPQLRDRGGLSLYGSMLRRIKAVGGKVKGVLWYQGESDANTAAAPLYKDRMKAFVRALREDLRDPDLPFLYVQIATWLGDAGAFPGWNAIQNAQLELEKEIPNSGMVAAIDSTLSDAIHLDAISQRRLGKRLALLAKKICYGDESIKRGPRPHSFGVGQESAALRKAWGQPEPGSVLRVAFDEVNGRLLPRSRVWGFSVEVGGHQVAIRDCRVVPEDPRSVEILLESPVSSDTVLWYGKGTNPACNLRDEVGFPVPVFGPVTIHVDGRA